MRTLAIILAGLLVLSGCTHGGASDSGAIGSIGNGATETSRATVQDEVVGSTPAAEGSGPESPQASSNHPTISVAALPIGGGPPDQVAGLQCQHVFLTNVSDHVPDGVRISVNAIHLDPDGVFSIVGDGCGGSDPSCVGWSWSKASLDKSCLVAAKQNDGISAQPGDLVTLTLAADLTCEDQATCSQLQPLFIGADGGAGSLGGSQLAFTVQPASSGGNG